MYGPKAKPRLDPMDVCAHQGTTLFIFTALVVLAVVDIFFYLNPFRSRILRDGRSYGRSHGRSHGRS